jgi:hypothetical protein
VWPNRHEAGVGPADLFKAEVGAAQKQLAELDRALELAYARREELEAMRG